MEINQELLINATGVFGGVGAFIFGMLKAIKMWTNDRSDIQIAGLGQDLFTRMNNELNRLTQINITREAEIAELRDKCIRINEEFTSFKLDAEQKQFEFNRIKQLLIDCSAQVELLHQINIVNKG